MDGAQPAVVVAEASPSEQAVETATDAAVEIATVQADRDVAIAETQAEAAVEIATVNADADDEDVAWLRAELATLRQLCETNMAASSSAMEALRETQSQLASLAAMMTEHTNTLSPPAHSPPATEPSEPDADVENPVAEPPTETIPPQRRKRWL